MINKRKLGNALKDDHVRRMISCRRPAQDYKIRYAFTVTEYYGAYMTDFIKDLVEKDCSKATKHLDAHPELLPKSLRIFRDEMKDLGNKAAGHFSFWE